MAWALGDLVGLAAREVERHCAGQAENRSVYGRRQLRAVGKAARRMDLMKVIEGPLRRDFSLEAEMNHPSVYIL